MIIAESGIIVVTLVGAVDPVTANDVLAQLSGGGPNVTYRDDDQCRPVP